MNKHTLLAILLTASLVGRALAGPSPTPTPTPTPGASPGPGCKAASWSPELYSFYGAKNIILTNIANIRANLSERRVFLQVTQGESSADVRLYEQQKDGTFTVTEWTTKHTSRLLADIDKAIIANKGVNCVGEQVKGILAKELERGKVSKAVPAPASPEAAFAHSVKEVSGEFIRSTVIILC
jgi:hypothetical protein